MPRRIKLEIENVWPYRMMGITSSLNDYRLVHFLSIVTGLAYKRIEDLHIKFSNTELHLPLFSARDKGLRVDYILIPNSMEGVYLIPAERRFDYFLIAGGEGKAPLSKISKELQKTQHIQFCHEVDITKWREAPLFFHDLEMGIMEMRKNS